MLGEDRRGDLDEALPEVIEVKAAGAGELDALLNEFTTEMRAQFDLFRRLRAGAEVKASIWVVLALVFTCKGVNTSFISLLRATAF